MNLSSKQADITHVADTALWVATYRARETNRPDALFKDPLAELLAGERGKNIAAKMPYPKILQWVLTIRTIAIDRFIYKGIQNGVDCVVNLGAGLDTRPYRMNLPSDFKWVEVDFANMIQYKNDKLKNEKPICNLQRISCDLTNKTESKKLFFELGKSSKKVLLLTEGVIPYLTNEDAATLSKDLFAVPTFHYWIQDYRNGGLKVWAPKRIRKAMKDSPFKFDAVDWPGFFQQHGWGTYENVYAVDIATEVKRPFPAPFPWNLIIPFLPKSSRIKFAKTSGYIMLEKSNLT